MFTLFTYNLLAQAAAQPGIFTYFSDSNAAGKAIIYLLMIFSVWAWSIMIGKYMDLKTMADENMSTERKLQASKSVIDAVVNFGKTVSGPYAALLKEAVGAWSRYDGGDLGEQNLTLRMGMVENALQRAVSVQTMRYEKKMVMLGSIISGAPFLGLLGTVWGVMDSFGSMSLQASATLQQLAPGVSGALLTTIAGLIVAIPSVFGYNYLLSRSKSMVNDLENFASSLADKIELESRMRDMLKRRAAHASQMAPKSNPYNVGERQFAAAQQQGGFAKPQPAQPQYAPQYQQQFAQPQDVVRQSVPQNISQGIQQNSRQNMQQAAMPNFGAQPAKEQTPPQNVFDFAADENSGPVPPRSFED